MPTPHRIDTHHHIFPPKWLAEERDRILDGAQAVPREQQLNWSPTAAIEGMDAAGTATAIISISTPGVWFGNAEQARRLARVCNDYGAQMARDFKGRFGMFAALPLPDVEGSLREIEYALDVLKLDGIGLLTSYGDTWPGNPKYAPVFDELNRRKAIVYFHPTAPTCCNTLVPGIASAVIEFPTDSTRCITNLLFSGTFTRCPDIRFIFSHGGGTLPMLAGRIEGALKRPVAREAAARNPKGALHEFKKLFYDVASVTSSPVSMGALLALAPLSQVLFGSDYPFCGFDQFAKELQLHGLSAAQLAAIERQNALRLFPKYA
jgi:predicted TIM-barrel fold metal-dependent hydrolase